MDKTLIVKGTERAPLWKFGLWVLFWVVVLMWGLYGAYLCLAKGLNQTNLDNRYAFGLWIFLDLTAIAFGAGAFFTGFLVYILKRHELKAVINSAVIIGFICYSGAVAVLAIDVGQPLRSWFTFWHANIHSMLTEVTFCITCYLTVLIIEYLPILFKNPRLKKVPSFLAFEFNLHKIMVVFAGIGTFLSFFHQGSIGGMFGVMVGRPFSFRAGFAIWPSSFFLFILSAVAVGPVFLLIIVWIVSKLSGKQLVKPEVLQLLGKISGIMLIIYVFFKGIDTLVWLNSTAPNAGFHGYEFYARNSFGTWILFVEIGLFGLLPALLLLSPKKRSNMKYLIASALMVCIGVALNRFVMTFQTMALPTFSFDKFLLYLPSWQEVATFMVVVAYGVLLYSFSFRYLPIFPQERELKVKVPGRQ